MLKPFLTIGNFAVRRILRSRFHWLLSGKVVMLEITGRKSGQRFYVPVNYRASGSMIAVMTYSGRIWWRNLRNIDNVPVHYRGRRQLAVPEIVTDDHDAIAKELIERGWVRKAVAPADTKNTVLIKLHMIDMSEQRSVIACFTPQGNLHWTKKRPVSSESGSAIFTLERP